MKIILIALTANLIAFVQIAIDKRLAEKRRWRISEFQLIVPTVFGGIIGTVLAMRIFRHKTKKRSFQFKVLLAFVADVGVAWYVFNAG